MAEQRPEGTPWMEYVWQTEEAKRKFESGELGYRDARKLDRSLLESPRVIADGAPEELSPGSLSVEAAPAPESAGRPQGVKSLPGQPLPGSPGFPDPRLSPSQQTATQAVDAIPEKAGRAWDFLEGLVTAPFATDWKAGLKPKETKTPAAVPEPMQVASEPEDAPPLTPDPAKAGAKEAPKRSSAAETTRSTSTGLPPALSGQAAKPGELTYVPPAWQEREMELELPDGRKVNATPTQMQAILATEKAKEMNALLDEYRREDDAARSAGMWAEIIRGVAALSVAQYGMKHGVDMSGFQLQPIDWTAQQRARREGVEAKTAVKRDVYGTYEGAAKTALDGQKEAHRAADDAAWKQFQAKVANSEALRSAQKLELDRWATQNQHAMKLLEVKAAQDAAAAKDPSMTPEQKLAFEQMQRLDLKYYEAKGKGEEELATALDEARRRERSRLDALGGHKLAGEPAALDSPPEEGFLTRLKRSILGE